MFSGFGEAYEVGFEGERRCVLSVFDIMSWEKGRRGPERNTPEKGRKGKDLPSVNSLLFRITLVLAEQRVFRLVRRTAYLEK
jgi:hypothetical protein